MRGRGYLVAIAMPVVAAFVTWSVFAGLTAKIPGETHCYKEVCHRVFSIEETRVMIGQTSDQLTTHYDAPGIDKFNVGQYTSSGEEFDATNPARTSSSNFPDGTELLVWHPVTRKAAHVRVNDFGPFWGKRTLDVTRRVAEDLGFAKDGVATLKVTVIWAPQPGEPRYRRGRVYPPALGLLGVVESAQHAALVKRLVASALTRNGYKGPAAPGEWTEPPAAWAEPVDVAHAATEQMDRDAAMVVAGLPRPPPVGAPPAELQIKASLVVAQGPPAFRSEAVMDASAMGAAVTIAFARLATETTLVMPEAAPAVDLPMTAGVIPVSVVGCREAPQPQTSTEGSRAWASAMADVRDTTAAQPASTGPLQVSLAWVASPLVWIGLGLMLTSLWGVGVLSRYRLARHVRRTEGELPPVSTTSQDTLVDDRRATDRLAAAVAEQEAREALLQRDTAVDLSVPQDVTAAARDDLDCELVRREAAREADVPATTPNSATPSSQDFVARNAVAKAALQERLDRARRESQLASIPSNVSRDLAAAVLGLDGSERYWRSIIGAQAQLQANIRSGSTLRIDGVIDGACEAPVLMIAPGAVVTGTIAAETVIVMGTVQGTIVARNVVITASAQVEGHLFYRTLSLDQVAHCELCISRLAAGVDPMTVSTTANKVSQAPLARAA